MNVLRKKSNRRSTARRVHSVRLEHELEVRLRQVANQTGTPASEIIRNAVRKACDEILTAQPRAALADIIGSVRSGGGDSRDSGRQFTKLVVAKHARRRKP